jgi:hypothetical protein
MNRSAGVEPFVSDTLPDAPWPVAARTLLTPREQSLYQSLLSLYPDHKIFVQVALSQLIDVPEYHPERQSIRNRFSQLVADFVLCRSDLSVIAVIELDDRSHERRDRQAADARKTKALADADLRLVRVPAGALPSEETLRDIIGADRPRVDRSEIPQSQRFVPAESELRLADDDWGSVQTVAPRVDHDAAESRAVRAVALRMALGGVVIVGGWFIYSQFVPVVMQRAFQPLAVRHVASSSTLPHSSSTGAPARISSVPMVAGPTQQELAEKRRVESQAAAALQRQKDRAWAAFYSAPASCEHPVDWKAQVECGNQYMRAKNAFEKRWVGEHASDQTTAATVTLDNDSIGGSRN